MSLFPHRRACLISTLFIMILATVPAGAGVSGAGIGAVAMPDEHSAVAASAVLSEGGNAVDAAVTAAFVLAVTYPEAGNIGGGGFMLSVMEGEAQFLDFRERAPQAASRDMYLDEGGNFVQRRSLIGGEAAGVPGTVRGLLSAHQRYGSLPWKRLLRPAIELARDGFRVPAGLADMARDKVEEVAGDTNFKEYFGDMRAGEIFRQPQLAATLQRLALDPEDFYTGITARQLVKQMNAGGGIINLDDLAAYRAEWRTPLAMPWREFNVLTAPPPSSGGIALLQMLHMRDDADEHFKELWTGLRAGLFLRP